MGQTRQKIDEKFLGQVRETEATVLEHLERSPDDFRALVMADFIAEVFPQCDPRTQGHARRFQEVRRALGEGGYLDRARAAGLEPLLVMINDQEFTKTANCWGVDNNAKGTNTNRIVLFRKP